MPNEKSYLPSLESKHSKIAQCPIVLIMYFNICVTMPILFICVKLRILVSGFIELSLNFNSGLANIKKGFKTIYQKISNTLLHIIIVVENHMDAKCQVLQLIRNFMNW